jgi:hypothetical protein
VQEFLLIIQGALLLGTVDGANIGEFKSPPAS